MIGFLVAGTDTGVGKTEIARALCIALRERGHAPRALKPVETGCARDHPEDALALRSACGGGQPLDDVCPYRFPMPAAPLAAADAEGAEIDLARIERLARAGAQPVVVEAAGGLLVPLARERGALVTNLDLAVRLALPVVLVARAGLGTINHSALSAAALAARGVKLAAIVLNRVAAVDDPSVATNAAWVGQMTKSRVLGPTPFVADAAERSRALLPFANGLLDSAPSE
ncbi:MAG TPA: dethiobiotin synthase [Myxococcales bacterium]|nr:dethiobiotin synthase [Myxococcales bacterium]